MNCKRNKLQKLMGIQCTDRVEICTPNFCACGCLEDSDEMENVIVLKDVDITYNDEKGTRKHKSKVCICEEFIVSFQTSDEE